MSESQGTGLSFSTFTHAIIVVVIGCSAVRRRYRATDGVKDPADAPQQGRIPPERGKIGAARRSLESSGPELKIKVGDVVKIIFMNKGAIPVTSTS